MLAALKHFFSDVKGSAQGVIVPEELYRAIATALGSGTLIGIIAVILQAMLDHVVTIFPDPAIAGLASISLTLILDLLRRQTHGAKPAAATLVATAPLVVPVEPVVVAPCPDPAATPDNPAPPVVSAA